LNESFLCLQEAEKKNASHKLYRKNAILLIRKKRSFKNLVGEKKKSHAFVRNLTGKKKGRARFSL